MDLIYLDSSIVISLVERHSVLNKRRSPGQAVDGLTVNILAEDRLS